MCTAASRRCSSSRWPKDDTDIWMMDRTPTGWSEPKHLGAPVHSEANEWFPTVAASGTLYFGSERPGGKGRVDIWRTRCVDGKGAYDLVDITALGLKS